MSHNSRDSRCSLLCKDINWYSGDGSNLSHFLMEKSNGNSLHCPKCTFTTEAVDELEEHVAVHEKPDRMMCDHCYFWTDDPDEFKIHIKSHAQSEVFYCNDCDFKTQNSATYKSHITVHIDESKMLAPVSPQCAPVLYPCTECSFTCDDVDILNAHKKLHDPPKIKLRSFSKIRLKNLKKNKRKKTKIKQMSCSKCGYICSSTRELVQHRKLYHQKTVEKCPLCDYSTTYKGSMRVHHFKNHSDGKYKCCVECDYYCKFQHALDRHMEVEHWQKVFFCPECDYSCKEQSVLNRHLKSHNLGGAMSCSKCSFTCKSEMRFKMHWNDHKEQEQLEAKEKITDSELQLVSEDRLTCTKCSFSCTKKSVYKRHIKHHIIEEIKCKKCSFVCTLGKDMVEHYKIHIQALTCKTCGYYSQCESNYKRHLYTPQHIRRENTESLLCDVCGFEVTWKATLRKHISNEHPEFDSITCHMCIFTCTKAITLIHHERNFHSKYSCLQCTYSTKHLPIFLKHIATHPVIEYSCMKCTFTCTWETLLKDHVEHHTEVEITRPGCSKSFTLENCDKCTFCCTDKSLLVRHLRHHQEAEEIEKLMTASKQPDENSMDEVEDDSEKLYCTLCNFSCTEEKSFKDHLKSHMPTDPTDISKCSECDFECSDLNQLEDHVLSHARNFSDILSYECSECNFCSEQEKKVKLHEIIRHRNENYQCSLCEFSCEQLNVIKSHFKTHWILTCDICKESFSKKAPLKKHMIKSHSAGRYEICTLCDRICKEGGLAEHTKAAHSGQEISCSECDFKCNDENLFEEHFRTHMNSFIAVTNPFEDIEEKND